MTTHYLGLKNIDKPELAGAEFTEDTEYNENYALNLQNISDIASKGAEYWFDGVDNQIAVTITDLDFVSAGQGSIIVNLVPLTMSTDAAIVSYIESGTNYRMYFGYDFSENKLGYNLNNGTNYFSGMDGTVVEGANYIAACVFSDVTNPLFYLNGAIQSGTVSIGAGTTTDKLAISGRTNAPTTEPFSGQISRTLLFNLALSADEVKALSSGAPVPYKYIGASQTPIYEGDWSAGVDGWVDYYATISGNNDAVSDGVTSKDNCLKFYCSADDNRHFSYKATGQSPGKKFRFRVVYYIPSGQTHVDEIEVQPFQLEGHMLSTVGEWTTYEAEITLLSSENDSRIYATEGGSKIFAGEGDANDDRFYLAEFSLTQIGCVLQLEQDGIGHNQWIDSSGNELYGDVSGALPINLPASHTEKFIISDISSDQTFTLPTGYHVSSIVAEETSNNALTGDLDVGIGVLGQEIVNSEAVGALAIVDCTLVSTGVVQSLSADTTITVSSSDWGSAVIDIWVIMKRTIA